MSPRPELHSSNESARPRSSSTWAGGQPRAHTFSGFPRRDTPKSFRDALDDLCTEMGEGRGCNVKRPKVSDMKDAGLDVVGWVPFADGRRNQLSVFGQCAAGGDWYPKLNELNPVDFCNRWLKENPAMFPFGAFFVPRQLGGDHWWQACVGERRLLFDRLRIGRLLVEIDNDLSAQCASWTASAVG